MTKYFSYRTVGTIVSGRLFDDLDRVAALVEFMTGARPLPGCEEVLARPCRDYFYHRFPQLKSINFSACTPDYYDCYEADLNDILGDKVMVKRGAALMPC